MAITATVVITPTTYQAGSTPAPGVSVSVSNSGAAAVVVTGLQFDYQDGSSNVINPPVAQPMPALGPGQTVSVAASGTSTIDGGTLAVASAANGRIAQMVPPNTAPLTTQPSQPLTYTLSVGCTVYTSDGAVTTATRDSLTVQYLGYA